MREAGFLGSLEPAERDALFERSARRTFRTGSFIFSEGGSPGYVVVVLSGRLKLSSYTVDGREIVLGVRGPGDLLGELSALDGQPVSVSVAALEPVEAIVVPSERFREFLAGHSRVTLWLLQSVIGKLRDADRKRVEFGAYDTTRRVAHRLVEMAERFGDDLGTAVRIDLPLSQEELAGWTGSSREAVSKALRTLRAQGCIETRRKAIHVLDLEALRARAT